MKKTKKIAAAVLAMTMAAGLAVTGCSGKGGSTDTDPAAAEQSKETAGSAGESKDDAAKADDGALHLTFYYPVNVGGSAAQLIEKICADFRDPHRRFWFPSQVPPMESIPCWCPRIFR